MANANTKIIDIPDEYLPEITDLPGDLARIAEAIEEVNPGLGVRVALLLGQLFPGIPLYMHNIKHLTRRIRDDGIRATYDKGVKVKDLAIRNNLSTRQIENILAAQPSQAELKSKQRSLF